MNRFRRSLRLALILSMASWPLASLANIPPDITSFQGVLRDVSEQPLSGTYPIVFRYWSDASSVDAAAFEIGSESHPGVAVTDGLFTVLLGTQPFVSGASGYGGLNINQMFGDFQQVWLQLEVDGDVLLPRIRFAAAPYAFNCSQLQDKGPGEFLRSEGSDNFTGSDLYGYTLTFDPQTTLNVGGAFHLAGAAVTSSADELNKLDGAGAGVTATNLTALTNGGNADALHSHTNTNAAQIDGLDSSQFLRSDASDSYTSGTLTFAAGTKLRTDGDIEVHGPVVPTITFWNNEFPNPTLSWNTHGAGTDDDRFELDRRLNVSGPLHAGPGADIAGPRPYHFLGNYLNGLPASGDVSDGDDLYVTHDVEIGQTLYVKGPELRLGVGGPDATQSLHFFEGGSPTGEALRWNDLRNGFELTDDTGILGRLSVGSLADDTIGYSRFSAGADAPDSGDMTVPTDLYVQDDLEVDETLYLNASIYMDEDGPDGDQEIYFFDGGLPGNQIIGWDDTNNRFQMSDNLRLWGSLDVNAVNAGPVLYNRFGTQHAPVSGDMTNINDVKIDEDLEVGSTLYLVGALVAGDGSPTTAQAFHSFGDGGGQDSPLIDSLLDVYVNGDLEVDGIIDVFNVHGPTATVLNLEADNNVRVMIDDDDSGTVNLAEWFHDASIASTSKIAELQEDGDFRIRGALSQNVAFDVAESFWASEPLAAGEIAAADPERPGAVRRASSENPALVLGIVSARPGVLLGSAPFDVDALEITWGKQARELFAAERDSLIADVASRHPELQSEEADEARVDSLALERFFERHVVPVALAGRVRVKADSSKGPIAVGDGLAPGPAPGSAVRAQDGDTVVAVALEPLAAGVGDVLAFVQPGMRRATGAAVPAVTVIERTPEPENESPVEVAAVSSKGPDAASGSALTSLVASFLAIGAIEPGDLVSIDSEDPSAVRVTDVALDPRVVGIVVAVDPASHTVSVALGGVVPCNVDASAGPIEPGDLLASSALPGHASRAAVPLPGTIVGKALARHSSGAATIRVLVLAR